MRIARTKSKRIVDFFIKNPTAKPKDVAAKFGVAVSSVYSIRKRALKVADEVAFVREVLGPQVVDAESMPANERQVGGDHYKNMGVEPWDVVDSWPIEQRIGYYRGNAMKYLMRMGTKDPSPTDVGKAQHYMQKLLEVLE